MDFWKLLYLKSLSGGGSGGDCQITRVESLDTQNLVNLRDLDSGQYIIYGYFSPYENSDISITTCAYESGFTSLRSFNRVFKNYYQVTPAEYKRN